MPQTTKDEAFYISGRIRKKIKELIYPEWSKYPKKITFVSIGVSMYPDCGEPIENLTRCSDTALYKAKKRGKDTTCIF